MGCFSYVTICSQPTISLERYLVGGDGAGAEIAHGLLVAVATKMNVCVYQSDQTTNGQKKEVT